MAKSKHARAPQGASGTSRNRRRQQGGMPAWMRPFCRASRALDASIRLIGATERTVARSERCAHRLPVRTSRTLQEASARLRDAQARLVRAAQELAAANECLVREPDETELVPELLVHNAQRCLEITVWLQETADGLFSLHEDVLLGLETGTLVPEPEQPAERRRPRIILAPRPASMRAFLLLRQPRVVDRIAPILRRRRRTPRPAALQVPQPSLLGRAPPLV
jgi:Tfp pilus assembly protein PilX